MPAPETLPFWKNAAGGTQAATPVLPLDAAGNAVAAAPRSFVAVTPSNVTVISGASFLRCAGAGNLVLRGVSDGSSVTIAVNAGEYVPFGTGKVLATTTATGIVAFIG